MNATQPEERTETRLAGLFGLVEGEAGRAIRLFSLIFFASAGLVLIKAAQSGVFMSAYGRAMIPWAFGASAITLATASAIAVAAAGRLGPVTLATSTLAIASCAILATRAMLALGLPGAPFLTYVIVEASCGVILIQTWSVVSEAVDARSAKRLLPIAGVGASLAWTIFGILVPRLVAHIGAAGLLLLAPLMLGLSIVFVRAVARIDLAGKPARGGKLGLLDGWKSGLAFVRTTPLMRLVQLLTVLALLGEQLMDYQLLATARERYTTEAGIAGFFGWFYGLTSAISLFLLLGVSGRLLSRLGAMLGLMLTPVLTVLVSLGAVIMPGLGPTALLRGTDRVLKPALWSSAMEQTQTPLPVVKRAQSRALSRGVVAPVFYAFSALILAILPSHFDLRLLSLVVLLLSTAMAAVIALSVRRRYVQALRRAIDDRRLVLDPDVVSTHGTAVPIDVDACEALGRELREDDEARALLAAELLGHAEGPSAARALLLGLEHTSAQVRVESAIGLSRVGDARAGEWLSPIVLRDPISDVRRAAVRALRALGARSARDALESALSDTDRGVRALARITLLEWDDPRGVESGSALLPLLDPKDREACEAALSALRSSAIREPRVLEAVRAILATEDRSLRMVALETITRTRARALLADVAPLLEDARTAADAVARLAQWGQGALETAAESVVDTSTTSNSRREGEKEALSRLLSHADVGVRDRATAALVRAQRKPAHAIPRAAVEPVLERELARAYRLAVAASGVRDPSLAIEVDLRFRETRHRLLQLLALRESRKLVRIVEVGLRKTSPQADAHVAELLEVALPTELARRIVPLFERLSPRERAQAGVKLGLLLPSEIDDPLSALTTLDDAHLHGACALVHPDRVPSQVRALVPLFERMKFLRSVPLFGELPGEDLRTIAEIVETIDMPAGEVVFRKGDTGDDLFVILRGKVAIREGKLDVATFGPREFFGELSVIDHEPRSADAIVLEDAQLLRLGSADLGELMARRPQIQEQFLVVLARRLREVTQRFSLQ